MKNILKVRNLEKIYGGKAVVSQLSFDVGEGEVIGLLGPNGAGKTTAFYMTIGLIAADGGSVFLNGKDISFLPIHERAQLGMAYLAQEPSVFRHLSVEDNITGVLLMPSLILLYASSILFNILIYHSNIICSCIVNA